jgi:hypothetical protein
MMSLLSLDMRTPGWRRSAPYPDLLILLPDGQPLRGGLIAVRAGVGLWVGHTAILTFLVLFGSSQKEQRQNHN